MRKTLMNNILLKAVSVVVAVLFWLVVVTAAGKLLCRMAEKRITVQGG